jgi:hypothetical protein
MKKAFFITIIILTSVYASGQLRMPNRPFTTLNSEKGYITINEFTFGAGWAEDDVPFSQGYFGFTTLHAYHANETVLVGGATGLLFYDDGTLIPLYADMRVNLKIDVLVPYLSASGGVLFNPSDFGSGVRIFINPAIGITAPLSRSFAVNISGGFLIQMYQNTGSANFVNGKAGITYKFLK